VQFLKFDIIRTLSEAIKRQILLNKDADLAFFLKAAEADMAANGTKESLDLTEYYTSNQNSNQIILLMSSNR